MIKYVDTLIAFSEVPDEISLCINISNCTHRCVNCHSSYLQEDIGDELTEEELGRIIGYHYRGITCVCFLGGDNNIPELGNLANIVRGRYGLKTAWYTGLDFHLNSMNNVSDHPVAQCFDYVKTGHYDENLGPLTSKTTNQRMYKKISEKPIVFEDITERFWR